MKIRQVLDRLDEISRRDFLKGAGAAAVGGLAGKDSKADWDTTLVKDRLTGGTRPIGYWNSSQEKPSAVLAFTNSGAGLFYDKAFGGSMNDLYPKELLDMMTWFYWDSEDDQYKRYRGRRSEDIKKILLTPDLGQFRILIGDLSPSNRPMEFKGFLSDMSLNMSGKNLNPQLTPLIAEAIKNQITIKMEFLNRVFTFSGKKGKDIGPFNE